MEITLIKIPEIINTKVQIQWDQLSKKAIEILIAELYRTDCITFKQAQNLLGCSSWEKTADILQKQGCELYYDKDDYEYDLESLGLKKRTDIQ